MEIQSPEHATGACVSQEVSPSQCEAPMQRPLDIAFRDLDPSDYLKGLVEERAERLERFHPRIIGCRVVIEAPHRSAEGHHPPLGISVEVDIPGRPRIVAKDEEAQRAIKGGHLS